MHRPQLRTSSPVSPHFSCRNPALHRLQSHTSHPLRPHVMAHAVWRFSTSSTLRGGIIWRRYFLFSSSLFFSSLARARESLYGNSLRHCLLFLFSMLCGLLADSESAGSWLEAGKQLDTGSCGVAVQTSNTFKTMRQEILCRPQPAKAILIILRTKFAYSNGSLPHFAFA